MASWWHRDVIAPGKLPLMLCFLAFVTTFAVTRSITRMIRDGRGPFRNQVTASGTHIHHSVPGIILLIIGAGLAGAARASRARRRSGPGIATRASAWNTPPAGRRLRPALGSPPV